MTLLCRKVDIFGRSHGIHIVGGLIKPCISKMSNVQESKKTWRPAHYNIWDRISFDTLWWLHFWGKRAGIWTGHHLTGYLEINQKRWLSPKFEIRGFITPATISNVLYQLLPNICKAHWNIYVMGHINVKYYYNFFNYQQGDGLE